jgi:flagellar protein FliS
MNTALRNRFVDDGITMLSNERVLLALYDRLLTDLDGAAVAIGARQPSEAHDKLVHGQRILEELHLAIDMQLWPAGEQLASLYRYAQDLLVTANLRKDAQTIIECRAIIEPLADTWRQAYEQHRGRPATQGATPAGRFELGA